MKSNHLWPDVSCRELPVDSPLPDWTKRRGGSPPCRMSSRIVSGICSGFLGLVLHVPSEAAMIFTDSGSFQAALPGIGRTLNFDKVDAETVIPDGSRFGGIGFRSNTGMDLIVSDHFDTTSPFNYLGVDDGFSNEFVSGHEIYFDFNGLIQAFGIYLIGSPGDIFESDFQLVAGGLSVFNEGIPEFTLADGGDVFFLGLIDPNGFSNARLNSFGDPDDPFFAFNIDDITTVSAVPEPGAFLLLSVSFLLFGQQLRNGVKKSRKNSSNFIKTF